ncbi:uncharacterized protein LOC127538502 [Antechinus flavipes]|uniref:uncharacterized protein LOC127538502 n=1 Tax=Antechinus flavipes TaxID=38775 RepID=UPI002235DDB9|nr:uncharacterized protein LOC127538502 [Antechinus flavipes]
MALARAGTAVTPPAFVPAPELSPRVRGKMPPPSLSQVPRCFSEAAFWKCPGECSSTSYTRTSGHKTARCRASHPRAPSGARQPLWAGPSQEPRSSRVPLIPLLGRAPVSGERRPTSLTFSAALKAPPDSLEKHRGKSLSEKTSSFCRPGRSVGGPGGSGTGEWPRRSPPEHSGHLRRRRSVWIVRRVRLNRSGNVINDAGRGGSPETRRKPQGWERGREGGTAAPSVRENREGDKKPEQAGRGGRAAAGRSGGTWPGEGRRARASLGIGPQAGSPFSAFSLREASAPRFGPGQRSRTLRHPVGSSVSQGRARVRGREFKSFHRVGVPRPLGVSSS